MEFEPEPDAEVQIDFTPEPPVTRDGMSLEFYDEWNVRPLDVNFGTKEKPNILTFLPDNHYCVVYRDAPQYNRIEYTDDDGNQRTIYDNQDLIDWILGFMISEWETEVPRNKERKSMRDLCGWNSQAFIGWRPDQEEKDRYELAQVQDLYPILGELSVQQVINSWQEEDQEDEEDGA